MPGLVALVPLLAAGEVEVSVGTAAETRAGVSPLYSGTESTRFVAAFVIPTLAMLHRDATGESSAQYAPRLFWRNPPGLQRRPLVLHSWSLAHRVRPTRRSEWRLSLNGTYGDVDYAALGQLLATQTALTQTSRILALAGSAVGAWQADRRTRLELNLQYQYRRSFGAAPTSSTGSGLLSVLPEQHILDLAPGMARRVARSESVSVSSGVVFYATKYAAAGGDTAYFSTLVWQPSVLWRDSGKSHQGWARAGIAVASRLTDSGGAQAWRSISPVGDVGLIWLLHRLRDFEVHSAMSASSTWYYDSVLDAGIPRGLASASVGIRYARRWQADLLARFSTDLTRQPLPGDPDETLLGVSLPVRFQVSPEWSLEAGVRWSERAPHLRAANFGLRNHELYGYASLGFTFREGLVSLRPQSQGGRLR